MFLCVYVHIDVQNGILDKISVPIIVLLQEFCLEVILAFIDSRKESCDGSYKFELSIFDYVTLMSTIIESKSYNGTTWRFRAVISHPHEQVVFGDGIRKDSQPPRLRNSCSS